MKLSPFWLLLAPVLLASCRSSTPSPPASQPRAAFRATKRLVGGPQTDVLVVGGTPSGVAAAIAAARQGSQVVLVERRSRLGGDIVYALLNMFDVPVNLDGTSRMAVGIFGEWYQQLGIAFDVDEAQALIEKSVKAEPNLKVLRLTRAEPLVENGRVVGAELFDRKNQSLGLLRAKATVDASNDMDFAARAGARYFVGRQEANPDRAMQSAGLLFEVAGVQWYRVRAYVRTVLTMPVRERVNQAYASDAAPTTSKHVAASALKTPQKRVRLTLGGGDKKYLWERGDLVRGYKTHHPNIMMLSINFGRQNGGDMILNTLNIVGVNGLDYRDRARAKADALAELTTFLPYLRGRVPGFKRAALRRVAPELYIRETRHLRGVLRLSVEDIRSQRKFPDRIALASYPIDLHPYKKGDVNPFGPKRYFYTLPLRSLVPQKLDGLFVASRCLSASYTAAGSARVIPITMGAGEAAGVAASLCARLNLTPHKVAASPQYWAQIQNILRTTGADVGDNIPTSERAVRH